MRRRVKRAAGRDHGADRGDRRLHRGARSSRSRRRATTPASSITGGSSRAPTSRPAACPQREWEDLLDEMHAPRRPRRALRYALPEELGGRGGTNLAMAVIREHLNRRPIGLHNDPQSEISIIGNFPTVVLLHEFGTPAQRDELLEPALRREVGLAFGLTEPEPRLRRHLPRDDRPPRRRGVGDRRDEAVQLGHAPGQPRPRLRAHLRRAGRAARDHRLHRPPRRARASRSSSTGGRSTCRPTTPR